MDDLVQWLREQIAEDRRNIELLPGGGGIPMPRWIATPSRSRRWMVLSADDDRTPLGFITIDRNEHEHVTRYDPRTTLAQCDAHAAIVDLHAAQDGTGGDWDTDPPAKCNECADHHPCDTIRALGLAYQHRPGYRQEWRP